MRHLWAPLYCSSIDFLAVLFYMVPVFHCCFVNCFVFCLLRLGQFTLYFHCKLATILLLLRSSHRIWLYFIITLGSLHCNWQAIGHSISSGLIGHTDCIGMLSHTAWWLLGTASPNTRYPTWQRSSNVTGMKMPLIGKLPLLCVASGCCMWSAVVILMSPTVFSIVCIF